MGVSVVHYFQLASQMILYFRGVYLAMFFFLELIIFIYKGLVLPYFAVALSLELILLLLLLPILHTAHVFMSIKGNLTSRYLASVIGLSLIIPAFFGDLFFTIWQTYVLRVEVVIFSIDLFFLLASGIAQIFVITVMKVTEMT